MAPLQVIIGKVRLWDYCSDYPERWLVYSVKKKKKEKVCNNFVLTSPPK